METNYYRADAATLRIGETVHVVGYSNNVPMAAVGLYGRVDRVHKTRATVWFGNERPAMRIPISHLIVAPGMAGVLGRATGGR